MAERRLKTPADVRRFCGWLTKQVLKGNISDKVAGKLGYLCLVILKAAELEGMQALHEKVTQLESQMRGNYYGEISNLTESSPEARIVN